MARVLDDVRVLDLSRFIAGPFCSLLLADMGAEVISVESPNGSPLRTLEPRIGDTSTYYLVFNRNKQSVTLNLRTEQGRQLFRELVGRSDVVLQNFRPGVMQQMGLDYETLRELNPRLVMVSISAFGQDGPYGPRPGFDQIIQAMSGLMSLTGPVDGPPMIAGSFIGDYVTGLYAALGTVMALYHRQRTGVGQLVDLAMLDSVFSLLMTTVTDFLALGRGAERTGNDDRYGAPSGSYRCRDGYVYMDAGLDHHFAALMNAIGRQDLIDDPRFLTISSRYANRQELGQAVEAWTSQFTRAELDRVLEEVGIPAGPVRSIAEVARCVQLLHRGQLAMVEHPRLGTLPLPGVTIKLSESPGDIRLPPPELGEHNQQIFECLLGHSSAEIARWKQDGVL